MRWRLANAIVRLASSSMASSRVSGRRARPRPRGSRSPRRRAGPDRSARRRSRASSSRPPSNWARARAVTTAACSIGLHVEPEPGDRPGIPAGRRSRGVSLQLGDLERPDDPPRVAQVDGRGEVRGESLETHDQWIQAVLVQLGLQSGADVAVARQRGGVDAAGDRAEVEAGATGQDRDAVALPEVGQHRAGVGDEVGDAERLVRVDQVEAVVGHPGAVRSGHLGRADVEAAEDLAGIGRDDLCVAARRRAAPRRGRSRGRSCRSRSGLRRR